MAIFRVVKESNYTVMCNEHLKELGMSLKAKGLLSVMLSLPDDWDYSVKGLERILGKEKEQAIQDTLNELKQFGYLDVKKLMPNETTSGRIEYEYIVYEHKQPKTRGDFQPLDTRGDFQPLVFRPLTIDKQNTNYQSNDSKTNIRTKEVDRESRTQVPSETSPCCSTTEDIENGTIENASEIPLTSLDDATAEIEVDQSPYPLQDNASVFEEVFNMPVGTGRDARLEMTHNSINTPARELFDYWNSKKIRVHKSFQSNYIERFTKIIQKYSIEEIKKFIDHYEVIVHDLNYYWTYIWDLQDFIDVKAERYLKFADNGPEWVNYNNGTKSQQDFRKSEFFSGDLERIQSGEKTISQIDKEYKEKARRLRDNPNKIKF